MSGLGSQLRSQVPVEGRGASALLHVAEHVVTNREGAFALLRVDPGQVLRRVLKVGLLVAKDQSSLNFLLKRLNDYRHRLG